MAHNKSRIIIKTVVIGKKIIMLFVLLLFILIFFISSILIAKQNYDLNKTSVHLNNIKNSLTVVGVNYKDGYKGKDKFSITGINNFSILPCFFDRKVIDNNTPVYAKEQPVQAVTAQVATIKVDESNNSSKKIEIKNETKYNVDTTALLNMKLDFDLEKNKPTILIVHTHGTESYTSSDSKTYSSARTTDKQLNMIRVGRQLKTELEKYGFNVIHDTNLNDYPSYNSSYTKTHTVIHSYLKKYPSIKCVFDIHRDAIESEDGTRVKLTSKIGDEKVSQVMIVCGTDGLGLENPNWQYNFSFALKIHNYLNNKYPGFMRPLNLRKERFNMHLTNGSLLFEIGTHGNTLEESIASCKYIAEGINEILK